MKATRVIFPASIGDPVKDTLTGFTGTVTGLIIDSGGNCHAWVTALVEGHPTAVLVACSNLVDAQQPTP